MMGRGTSLRDKQHVTNALSNPLARLPIEKQRPGAENLSCCAF